MSMAAFAGSLEPENQRVKCAWNLNSAYCPVILWEIGIAVCPAIVDLHGDAALNTQLQHLYHAHVVDVTKVLECLHQRSAA